MTRNKKRDEPYTVVVDSDAIVSLAYPDDEHHLNAKKLSAFLLRKNTQLIYPSSIIIEATTALQRTLSLKEIAYNTAISFAEITHIMTPLDPAIFYAATSKFFSKKTSKKNTLFDCIVAATAEHYQADAIFSFDKYYKKQGFTLVSDLYAQAKKSGELTVSEKGEEYQTD